MHKTWAPLAAGIALALAGCGGGDEGAGSPDAVGAFDQAKTVSADGTVMPISRSDMSIAEKAVLALADHLDVPVTEISVDSVRAIEWRDSSIGCPQPGQAYMQVITPGNKITLRHDGKVHVVHEANGNAFVCVRQKPAVASVTNTLELVWGEQAAIAREDLAAKLNVEVSQIILASARATTWTDTSLGCADPGESYEDIRTEGYVLTLRHGSRNFTYHTDLDRVIACPAISED